jgi:hypothetical protein
MGGRRVVGAFLIAASLAGFTAAIFDLPIDFQFGRDMELFVARSATALWLVIGCGLAYAMLLSKASRDKVGVVLSVTGFGLAVTCIAGGYLGGVSRSVFEPTLALATSVVVTTLGWHLVMPPRAAGGPSRVVERALQPEKSRSVH